MGRRGFVPKRAGKRRFSRKRTVRRGFRSGRGGYRR